MSLPIKNNEYDFDIPLSSMHFFQRFSKLCISSPKAFLESLQNSHSPTFSSLDKYFFTIWKDWWCKIQSVWTQLKHNYEQLHCRDKKLFFPLTNQFISRKYLQPTDPKVCSLKVSDQQNSFGNSKNARQNFFGRSWSSWLICSWTTGFSITQLFFVTVQYHRSKPKFYS